MFACVSAIVMFNTQNAKVLLCQYDGKGVMKNWASVVKGTSHSNLPQNQLDKLVRDEGDRNATIRDGPAHRRLTQLRSMAELWAVPALGPSWVPKCGSQRRILRGGRFARCRVGEGPLLCAAPAVFV